MTEAPRDWLVEFASYLRVKKTLSPAMIESYLRRLEDLGRFALAAIMTLRIATCVFVVAPVAPALAQPDQRLEVFGGYAYSTQPPGIRGLLTKHLHGWRAAGAGYLTSRFGLRIELTGLFGAYASKDFHSIFVPRVDPPIRQLAILAGPQFKVLHAKRAAATIHALIGTARVRRADPHSLGLPSPGTWAFGASFGGSFDLNVGRVVAIRLVEPSLFLCAGRPECREKSIRIGSGLLFRFLER